MVQGRLIELTSDCWSFNVSVVLDLTHAGRHLQSDDGRCAAGLDGP